jgi:O-antigen ligase
VRTSKTILSVGLFLCLAFGCTACSFTPYFANPGYLEYMLVLELLVATLCAYQRFFFPVIVVAFLLAGVNLPVDQGMWTVARWLVLAVGALVGALLMLRHWRANFGVFHLLAVMSLAAALVSAAVSPFTGFSLLKVLSLFLLFLYGATGARLAAINREERFFSGLLVGCEIFVGAIAVLYLVGFEAMGNPNSLGATMGVVAEPVLLWGILLNQTRLVKLRRTLLFGVSVYLILFSHSRAGMLAALVSSVVLCLALRRYRLLIQGFLIFSVLTAALAVVRPSALSEAIFSFKSGFLFKGVNGRQEGLLNSRESPWNETMDSIRSHFWFGTGFGTSDTGQDPTTQLDQVATHGGFAKEHGSSYLEILSWVGMLGIVPFFLLVATLSRRIVQSVALMHKIGSPQYGFVPLALILIAGIVHAAFEDWLFAPGYYLCIFFWSMAFIFMDQMGMVPVAATAPSAPVPPVYSHRTA